MTDRNQKFEADQSAEASFELRVPIGSNGWDETTPTESIFVVVQNGAAVTTKALTEATITVTVEGTGLEADLVFTTVLDPADLAAAVPGRLGWEWWASIESAPIKRADGPFILYRSAAY